MCIGNLIKLKGGAEVEVTALFADVRGSTPLAKELGATATHGLMDRFCSEGVEALIRGGALIERFTGDQIVWISSLDTRARRALEAGIEVLHVTRNVGGKAGWVSVGAGVHTGTAFVRTVGRPGEMIELTALQHLLPDHARMRHAAALLQHSWSREHRDARPSMLKHFG